MTSTSAARETEAAPTGGRSAPGGDRRRWAFAALLALLALLGLGIRLGYADERLDRPLGGDARFYHAGANLVASGRGFVNPYVYVDDGVLLPAADHPPLQTAYLAGFSELGLRTDSDHVYAGVALGTLTIVLGGLAGRAMGGARLGLLAAGLLAVYPNVWRHDALVMAETPAVFCTVLTIWLAYRYLARPTTGRLVATSAAVALATLARPELLGLAVVVIVPAWWITTRDRPWWPRLGALAAAGATCAALLAPWVTYNLARFDRPVLLSSQFEVTFATANCDSTYYGELIGYWDLACADRVREAAGLSAQSDEAHELLLATGRSYVRSHLERVPVVVAARLGRLTGLYRPGQTADIDVLAEGNTPWVVQAGRWSLYPMMALAAAGAVVLRRRRVPVFPALGPIVVVVVTVIVLYTATRFRAPADASLCLLAAAALDAGWRWWHGRPAGRGAAPLQPGSAAA